jgi:hypothetical protein
LRVYLQNENDQLNGLNIREKNNTWGHEWNQAKGRWWWRKWHNADEIYVESDSIFGACYELILQLNNRDDERRVGCENILQQATGWVAIDSD